MDRPRQNDPLGVNKNGKNIRKCPLHQPSFAANANLAAAAKPQVQPHVYNIRRSDFKSIVQQLTGSPSRESFPRPPQNNSSKPQNTRLQRTRPSPLTQINRPVMSPLQHHPQSLMGPPPSQHHMPQVTQQQPMMGQGDQFWSNNAESPISEYMRCLQSSLGDEGLSGNQMQPGLEHRPYMPAHEQLPNMPGQEHQSYMPVQQPSQPQPYMLDQPQPQPQAQPQPQPQPQPGQYMMHGSQPQMNMQGPIQPSLYLPPPGLVPDQVPFNLPPPQFNGYVPVTSTLPSPMFNQIYGGLPSPRYNDLYTG